MCPNAQFLKLNELPRPNLTDPNPGYYASPPLIFSSPRKKSSDSMPVHFLRIEIVCGGGGVGQITLRTKSLLLASHKKFIILLGIRISHKKTMGVGTHDCDNNHIGGLLVPFCRSSASFRTLFILSPMEICQIGAELGQQLRNGRPKKTTAHLDRKIIRSLKRKPVWFPYFRLIK